MYNRVVRKLQFLNNFLIKIAFLQGFSPKKCKTVREPTGFPNKSNFHGAFSATGRITELFGVQAELMYSHTRTDEITYSGWFDKATYGHGSYTKLVIILVPVSCFWIYARFGILHQSYGFFANVAK